MVIYFHQPSVCAGTINLTAVFQVLLSQPKVPESLEETLELCHADDQVTCKITEDRLDW